MKLKMKNISVRLVLFLLWFPLLKSNGQGVPFPLDSMLSKSLDSMQVVLNVKSLSAAMQFPDTAVWARATGISSLVPLDSVTTSDVYLIGSVTKTMTSACVLQLS
jgi:CubicO group peptidase (beta-lactamase class C family)